MSKNGNGTVNELPENERPKAEEVDLAAEFAELGKRFAEAMQTAWNSEERHKIEREVRDGMRKFADEVDGAVKKIRESDTASKVGEGVKKATSDFQGKENVRKGLVTALRGVSEALDRMANSFTPVEDDPVARDKPTE